MLAWCDTVHLDNGDRVSGEIEGIAEGRLALSTAYAGTLEVDLRQVRGMVTDAPVALRLKDGTCIEGGLAFEGDAQLLFVNGTKQTVTVSEIQALAADPETLASSGEPKEEETSPVKWSGSADAGASWRSGETDTLNGNLGVTVKREAGKHALTLELRGGYGEVDSEENTRRIKADARWEYYVRKRLYVFVHIGADHDPAHRLELRVGGGGGFGYDVVQRKRSKLLLEAGLDYHREYWNRYTITELDDARSAADDAARAAVRTYIRSQFDRPLRDWTFRDFLAGAQVAVNARNASVEQETETKDTVSLRLGASYEQQLFTNSTLTESLVVLPGLDDIGAFRLTSDLTFTTPLSEKLSLRLSLKTEYDSDTDTNDDQLNNTLITSLRYLF